MRCLHVVLAFCGLGFVAAGVPGCATGGAAASPTTPWAIGQTGLDDAFQPADAGPRIAALMAFARDPDPAVRADAAVALGRLRAATEATALLADPAPAVRAAALLGLFWHIYLSDVPLEAPALAAALALARDPSPDVRAALAALFARRPEPRAELVLQALARDPDPRAAVFAIRGLGKLAPPPGDATPGVADAAPQNLSTAILLAALVQDDPRAAVRAEAAQALALPSQLPEALARDPDATVRAIYAERTGRTDPAAPPSRWVASRAVATRAKSAFDVALLGDADPLLRAAAASALGHAGSGWRAAFDRAFGDPDLGVKLAALEALGDLQAHDAPAQAAQLLAALIPTLPPAPTLRGAAAEAARALKAPSLAPVLAALAADSQAPAFVELRETVVDALAELEDWPAVTAMARDPAPSVRAKVAQRPVPPAPPRARVAPDPSYAHVTPAHTLTLETERGAIVIALDAVHAPQSAAAITALARRGFYDGLVFHRLVPNFVVQGGDPTGTGWGDAGFQLPDELSNAPFDEGTVGIAKAGPDTGSCQLFITLGWTPHLAGRYTALGHVVAGLAVVHALELGDRIVRAVADAP